MFMGFSIVDDIEAEDNNQNKTKSAAATVYDWFEKEFCNELSQLRSTMKQKEIAKEKEAERRKANIANIDKFIEK